MNDPALIGVIATDRASAHLASQIAVKTFVPVLALSADKTLTSTNIPWIFRLDPDHSVPEAIECLLEAARHTGPNRGKIRDYLATVSFQPTGEPK
jgi:hypothetical protein